MKSVEEIWIEQLVGEIERVSLDVDEGDEHVDHVQGWELHKLVLQIVLHYLPELEAIWRMEVESAKSLTYCTYLGT